MRERRHQIKFGFLIKAVVQTCAYKHVKGEPVEHVLLMVSRNYKIIMLKVTLAFWD